MEDEEEAQQTEGDFDYFAAQTQDHAQQLSTLADQFKESVPALLSAED